MLGALKQHLGRFLPRSLHHAVDHINGMALLTMNEKVRDDTVSTLLKHGVGVGAQ